MIILILLGLFTLSSQSTTFPTPLRSLPFNHQVIVEDLEQILITAKLPKNLIRTHFKTSSINQVRLSCDLSHYNLHIESTEAEKTSTFYKALRELGFYFPHPLKQISPLQTSLRTHCGKTWIWKPVLAYRGFHLHTLHPSEWVAAFYQSRPDYARAIVRWLARNQQNILDLSLLDVPLKTITSQIKPIFLLAQSFQIHPGLSLGLALQQQNSYKLLNLWESYITWNQDEKIISGIKSLASATPLSFMVLEAGTSEFTSTGFEKTVHWLNLAAKTLKSLNIAHFTKVHVSSNQTSSDWGNFNYLPQYCSPSVGILPHTVMFYGILDEKAPMYGNKNFSSIFHFMLKEKSKRPTWYYPETSYWVAMDIDIPLFLTDYLVTRAQDFKTVAEKNIEGHLNFTSGQTLGYWLFDWNLALMNDSQSQFDPLYGLKLLGESPSEWQKMIDYQSYWYKKMGIISLISAANLQDEFSKTHRIHDRNTMKEVFNDPLIRKNEIKILEDSLLAFPDINIKDPELKEMIQITKNRHLHALLIRQNKFSQAASVRTTTQSLIRRLGKIPTNYPELPLFKKWKNPTAYQFGYLYPADTLYFWEREERQLRTESFFPFEGNIYDVLDIIL
jgi:hypothetical protein